MKICPVCKSEYPDDSKFCAKDGSPLEVMDANKCPHCGAQLMGKGKFCPECGKSTEVVEKKAEEKGCKCPKCGFETDKKIKFCPDCGYSFAETVAAKKSGLSEGFVLIRGGDMGAFLISKYEVTQDLYQSITGENPSNCKGTQRPVENISWYDAIRFCNMLSKKEGKTPVYSVDGKTDVKEWSYSAHRDDILNGDVVMNIGADGYRLPTKEEWDFAAAGGENYTYAGSNVIDTVAWYKGNSENSTHKVAQKKANGYGLYDMTGNVNEWCWDIGDYGSRYGCGGSWRDDAYSRGDDGDWYGPNNRDDNLGLRLACRA